MSQVLGTQYVGLADGSAAAWVGERTGTGTAGGEVWMLSGSGGSRGGVEGACWDMGRFGEDVVGR